MNINLTTFLETLNLINHKIKEAWQKNCNEDKCLLFTNKLINIKSFIKIWTFFLILKRRDEVIITRNRIRHILQHAIQIIPMHEKSLLTHPLTCN